MVDHMKQKMFKTLEQQIEILRGKGLVINDVEEAKKEIMKRAQRGLLTREELKNIEVPILREMNK